MNLTAVPTYNGVWDTLRRSSNTRKSVLPSWACAKTPNFRLATQFKSLPFITNPDSVARCETSLECNYSLPRQVRNTTGDLHCIVCQWREQ
jgi:hypothetical protein